MEFMSGKYVFVFPFILAVANLYVIVYCLALYAGELDREKSECEVCLGKHQLIFISPESLLSSNLWQMYCLSQCIRKILLVLLLKRLFV